MYQFFSIKSKTLALVLIVMTGVFSAQAQETDTKLVEIAPQPLASALQSFSDQAGLQFAYVAILAEGVQSLGTTGSKPPREALDAVLADTGLQYRFLNEQTVAITPIKDSNEVSQRGKSGKAQPTSVTLIAQAQTSAQENQTNESRMTTNQDDREDEHVPRLEEIIVSAQKREESLQDVAVSITAISARVLEDFGIDDFRKYSSMVPSLSSPFHPPAASLSVQQIGLRGVQTVNGTTLSGQNTVGFYINNTPIPLTDPRLLDLERIEVLRGPQGTLYGSSSLAGTIKLVTKRPDTSGFEGRFDVGLSSTKYGGLNYEVDGIFNLPLSDKVALRMSAYAEENQGYVDFTNVDFLGVPTGAQSSNVNDQKVYGGRLMIAVEASDNLRITPSVMYNKREATDGSGFMPLEDGRVFFGHIPVPATDEFVLADIEIEWDIGPVQIVSTTSYFNLESDIVTDFTDFFSALLVGNPFLPFLVDIDHEEWTHETRVLSAWESDFQFVAGFFYTDRFEQSKFFSGAEGVPDIFGFPNPNDTIFSSREPRDRRELAFFGEVSVDINEWLRAVVGLRYFDFQFSTVDEQFGNALFVDGQSSSSSGEASQNGVIPRFRLEVRANDDQLYFASASKGFRMGGANFTLPSTPGCADSLQAFFGEPGQPTGFDSDTLWSYELGGKTSWFDHRLNVNFSGFLIDWNNTQVNVDLTTGNCPFNGLSTNLGSVQTKGFEIEIGATPLEGLNISAGISRLDVQINEDLRFPGATVILAQKGDRLPDIAKWSFSILTNYVFPVTNELSGFIRGDYRYQSRRQTSLAIGSAAFTKAPYQVANFQGGVTYRDWEAAVFVENAFNSTPNLIGEPITTFASGRPWMFSLRPRTIGLRFSRRL